MWETVRLGKMESNKMVINEGLVLGKGARLVVAVSFV